MNKTEASIKVTLDYAPEGEGEEFMKWCEQHGFDPLGSGRRAWCGPYSTYLRSALGIASTGSGETFLFYKDDLTQ